MKKIALFALAFVVMTAVAFASLVRFGGHREKPVEATQPNTVELVEAGALAIPVAGVARSALSDTWGQSRANGLRAHQGIDIMAPGGTSVVAAADGVVEKLFLSGAGGITLYERSRDRGATYYYAHLAGYAPGISEGTRLKAGQQIAYVGDTGNAGKGNTHLHFGIARMRPDDRWWQGEPVNPYPLLARAGAAR
jgi:murein DD-endopeptidase MepM/ murein hydrolase activator NlpD